MIYSKPKGHFKQYLLHFFVILSSGINKMRITKPFIFKLVDRAGTILERSIINLLIKELSKSKSFRNQNLLLQYFQ